MDLFAKLPFDLQIMVEKEYLQLWKNHHNVQFKYVRLAIRRYNLNKQFVNSLLEIKSELARVRRWYF